MKRIHFLFIGIISTLVVLSFSNNALAASLQIAPLQYKTTLSEGESKKGYIDVSNPESKSVVVNLSVQAFRQINDEGGLEFYDDNDVTSGIELDLAKITLEPQQSMRVYFLLDGSKLPRGNVFAAIFASTDSDVSEGVSRKVRVGSLISIVNGDAGVQSADVVAIKAPLFQIGSAVTMDIDLHNPSGDKSSGFYPSVKIDIWPWTTKTVDGPLLFAGRTRSISVSQGGSYIGVARIVADASGKKSSKIIFVVTGYWRWLTPAIAVLLLSIGVLISRRNQRRHRVNFR